jgi:1-deoxy-D-xylulose-5-phosphate synthase
VNCRFLKPYDHAVFKKVVREHPAVLIVEEGQVTNGFGAFMAREIHELELEATPRVATMGMPDAYIEHGARDGLLADIGLDANGITVRVTELAGSASHSALSV